MGVNIWGIIHGIRHFVPAILKHGEEGHVVNTASVAGFQSCRGTNQGPYSMLKYAALSPEVLELSWRAARSACRCCARPDQHEYRARRPQRPDHLGGPQIERRAGAGRTPRHRASTR